LVFSLKKREGFQDILNFYFGASFVLTNWQLADCVSIGSIAVTQHDTDSEIHPLNIVAGAAGMSFLVLIGFVVITVQLFLLSRYYSSKDAKLASTQQEDMYELNSSVGNGVILSGQVSQSISSDTRHFGVAALL